MGRDPRKYRYSFSRSGIFTRTSPPTSQRDARVWENTNTQQSAAHGNVFRVESNVSRMCCRFLGYVGAANSGFRNAGVGVFEHLGSWAWFLSLHNNKSPAPFPVGTHSVQCFQRTYYFADNIYFSVPTISAYILFIGFNILLTS